MKNNSMLIRTISGAVLLVIALVTCILGGPVLLCFVEIVSLIGLYELYRALGIFKKITKESPDSDRKNNTLGLAGFIGTAIYYFFVALKGIPNPGIKELESSFINLVFVFIVIMLSVFLAVYVFTFPKFTIEKVAYAFLSVVYIPVFMSFLYFTRSLNGGEYLIWLIFISAWICDTCAYFSGTLLGKHKLAPVLSPKKSIEGSIGGILGSMLVAFIFGYFIEYKLFNGANNSIRYMVICLVGSVVSQVGDLAASAIKRNKEIKDYGNLIPGHGGILDRFDSIIFVAPFVFLLSYFF